MGVKSNFKVVIAGGSITGLTLANMLQQHNIDFIVLEAYPDIAPQVGASIGLLPHGNRILDQLGLYHKVLELCPPLDSFHFRDHKGKVICEFRGMNQHGYPITFLDRQMVLQMLYENIRDKSKVLTNKHVYKVDLMGDGVVVKTQDGSTYHGDILVGADGIHSAVRGEMWRIANKMSPGWFPNNEHNSVPCDYGCIFGISDPCDGIEPGASNSIFRNHQSYIVNGGPSGRVYWFFFFKLPETAYGDEIPNYTEEDERRVLAEHENDDITPSLKFKKILDNKVTSVLVPLQEYVFKQWYYKRIITIGDSSHKFHPIAGHGGNAAIESAATFVNSLLEVLGDTPSAKSTQAQIEKVFAITQKVRQDRVETLKQHSHEQQRTESLDTALHQFAAFQLLPRTDKEDVTFNFSRNMPLAEKLSTPSINPVPRLVPYKDELLSAPVSRGLKKWYFIAFYLLIAGLVHYGMWMRSASYGLGEHLEATVESGTWEYDTDFPVKRSYIGISFIDDYLAFLAAVFVPGLKDWDANFGMIQLYFLGMLLQPIAVYVVESYRKRNKLNPLYLQVLAMALINIWLTLVQSAGIGIYMPIYYAVYTFVSEPETYWWPLNREVPIENAVNLIWSVAIGYALPTLLMFQSWENPLVVQNFEALWQPSPMLVTVICSLLAAVYMRRGEVPHGPRKAHHVAPDVAHLQALYLVTGVIGLLFHVYCLSKIFLSASLTLESVFWPDFTRQPKPFGEGLRAIFLADFWGFEIASYGWLCMAVWDLKRVGRTTVGVAKSSAWIALGYLLVGPGATMSAVWYWRESLMAKTLFK
ncbi:hypothetical protein LCI18_001596 [Fusarium solani-melongenae]|uniref:Uncharacterized protein n=1 Tax=Fusarium solani subsp. cucurbitae TaxID=2747967 RepID=A0ACD3YP31_FUSSC|nr:hypothetical protein LCI18_001596 [Fusarium solani-melongenae]